MDALTIIHNDEVTHVTAGHRWFTFVCNEDGVDPVTTFREEVRQHFSGRLKGPFNVDDREKAGLTRDFYEDLAGELRDYPDIGSISLKERAMEEAGIKVEYQS